MMPLVPAILVCATAALVFAAGYRTLSPQNPLGGGIGSMLLFLLHPNLISGIQNYSLWDALFAALFVSAWLWMENWSLFMRSWVLAGVYAFGLWLGSPFVLWGLVAMAPWVIFNRRPLAALGGIVTVFIGGLLIFAITWGGVSLFVPHLGRPLFTQWIRWSGLQMPPAMSLPWCLLMSGAVYERLRSMLQSRRSDATIFVAALLVVTALCGSVSSGLAMIALSSPLLARMLVKKDLLYHRRVRWLAVLSSTAVLAIGFGLRPHAWLASGLAIAGIGVAAAWLYRKARLPPLMIGQAVCAGAFFGESVGTIFHLFPG